MQTQLQFVKGKGAANRNDQLAVEKKLLLRQPGETVNDIRKITRERLTSL